MMDTDASTYPDSTSSDDVGRRNHEIRLAIIDDDAFARERAERRYSKREGFEFYACKNRSLRGVKELLNELIQQSPDLIILDLLLEGSGDSTHTAYNILMNIRQNSSKLLDGRVLGMVPILVLSKLIHSGPLGRHEAEKCEKSSGLPGAPNVVALPKYDEANNLPPCETIKSLIRGSK